VSGLSHYASPDLLIQGRKEIKFPKLCVHFGTSLDGQIQESSTPNRNSEIHAANYLIVKVVLSTWVSYRV
jgi:predicted neuraminidase